MDSKNKTPNIDTLLHTALQSAEKPGIALLERVKSEMVKERSGIQQTGITMRVKKLLPLAAGIVMMLAASTTAFAALGGFDWFIRRINPPFAEIILPVMNHSEDQGIRITMLGARRFDQAAVVYVSIQDISGENRVTEATCIYGTENIATRMRFYDGGRPISGGTSVDYLYFDEDSNTQYVQFILSTNRPLTDDLTLAVNTVVLERRLCDISGDVITEAVKGEWRVTAHLEYTPQQYDDYISEITVENLVFNVHGITFDVASVVINPISVRINGHMRHDDEPVHKTLYVFRRFLSGIYIETADEIISLNRGSGGGPGVQTFNYTFRLEAPLDMSAVTAIVINGQRISLP